MMAVLFCAFPWKGALADEARIVTIACIDYDGLYTKNSDGTETGYAVEYFNKVNEITGWKTRFVDMTWPQAYEGVQKGAVDFYCVARRTEAREANFDFSTYPLLDEQMNLYVRKDANVYYDDFEKLDGMRVGMLAGSEEIEYFQDFQRAHDFKAAIVEFDMNAQAEAALLAGQIDAVALVSYSVKANLNNLKMAANFGMVPAYLMSAEGSPLMSVFCQAQQRIMMHEPDFFDDLMEKYFPAYRSVMFTAEEMKYIQSDQVLTVGLPRDDSPLSFQQDGAFSGMVFDMMELLSTVSGLRFSYVYLEEDGTEAELAASSETTLVAGVRTSPLISHSDALAFSDPLLSTETVMVARGGKKLDASGRMSIAVPNRLDLKASVLQSLYPGCTLQKYATSEDCLVAVDRGGADTALENFYVARALLQNPRYDSLQVLPTDKTAEQICIAVSKENGALLSILNKAIASLDKAVVDQIIVKYTVEQPYRFSVGDILYKYRFPVSIIFVLFLLCIALLSIILLIRMRNMRNMQAKNLLLAEAVEQANHANRAKSQFLSRMSHEIRTPINAIVGIAQLADKHRDDPEKVGHDLQQINSSSKLLLSIINDVLDMSAIENEKLKIAHTEFDLKAVIDEIAAAFYPQCQQKGIAFETQVNAGNGALIGDSLRLKQVLMNLVSNAYKFTPSGGSVRLSVEQTERRNEQVFIRFSVSDTGCGMSDDLKQRLFLPFEQEDAATAQKHGGSGLGLAIAKNLIDLMQGAVVVDSSRGVGTTFTVDLPFEVASSAESRSCATESDAEEENFDFTGKTALLVEDNPLNAEIATELLGLVNMRVVHADNGKIALDMFEASNSGAYDLILMDIQMPVMNGYESAKAIRRCSHPDAVQIPILAMTANAFVEDISAALSAGMNGHIAKPIDTRKLYENIRRCLEPERSVK